MGGVTTAPAWYLMRGSGVVTLLLLTGVVVLGVLTSNRVQIGRLPRFVTAGVHRSISLLSVVFLGIHVGTALVDPYAAVNLVKVLVPLPTSAYSFWLGLGALSLDIVGAVIVTSLLRRLLSLRAWKGVHRLSYASWPVALAHALGIGTDTSSTWFVAVAVTCTASIVLAIVWRLVESRRSVLPKALRPRRLPLAGRAA